MKLSLRLATLGITAVAFTGVLGAQQRSNGHASARPQARAGGQAAMRSQPRMNGYNFSRSQPRASGQSFARIQAPRSQGVRVQQYSRGGIDMRGGNPYQNRNVYRTPTPYRVPVADHGRPLITRGIAGDRSYGRSNVYAGARFGGDREYRGGRWFYGGRAFPFGWESRVVFGGFFPIAYGGYCAAVPMDYDYMLPPMLPTYDPCLFGDRVIVFDRFSRHIMFVATL